MRNVLASKDNSYSRVSFRGNRTLIRRVGGYARFLRGRIERQMRGGGNNSFREE